MAKKLTAYLSQELLKQWHTKGYEGAFWLVRGPTGEEVEMEVTEVSPRTTRRNNEIALGEAIRCVKPNTFPRISPTGASQ